MRRFVLRLGGLAAVVRQLKRCIAWACALLRLLRDGKRGTRLVMFVVGRRRSGMSWGLRGYAVAEALRRRGWRVLVLNHWLTKADKKRFVRWYRPDLLYFQKARSADHQPSLYGRVPAVIDIDDADFDVPKYADQTAACVGECAAAVAGSEYVRRWLETRCPATTTIWTSGPAVPAPKPRAGFRDLILVWACSQPERYRASLRFVCEVASEVARRRTAQVALWVIGASYRALVADKCSAYLAKTPVMLRVLPFLSYRRLVKVCSKAFVGLAPLTSPSEGGDLLEPGKSFGKVLVYLQAGIPVVCSECGEYPKLFRNGENGFLARDALTFADRICLLADQPVVYERVRRQAWHEYMDRLTTDRIALEYDLFLRTLLARTDADHSTLR